MTASRPYLIVWLLVLLYYALGTRVLLVLSRIAVSRVSWTAKYPFFEVEHCIRFTLAALLQCVFCVLLIAFTGASPVQLGLNAFRPVLLLCGLALGLGEMAFGSFLCHVGMRTVMAVSPASVPPSVHHWLALLHAGWMREIVSTIKTAPPIVSGAAITLYIATEEIIFRSILVSVAISLGQLAAVITSTLLFAFIQTLHMPSWRSAFFPVTGALITGTIHGTLFILVPEIWPLILAHLTLFVSGVL